MNVRIREYYRDFIYYSVLLLIILFSFLNFSYRFYPLLNADMAINILMTPGYSLPNDLYAWGQDRGGTMIPMLSNLLYRIIPISPVSAVSVVHYLILIIGYIAASTLLKSRSSKIFLAIMWFLPPMHFTGFVLFPFGTQLSLFLTGVFFLNRSDYSKSLSGQNSWLSLSCMLMILSIWVSELGIIMVLLLCSLRITQWFRQKRVFLIPWGIYYLINIFFWMILGLVFIIYAKSIASRIDVYSDNPFNNIEEIIGSVKIIINSLFEVFTFSINNFIESLFAWMLMFGIPLFILVSTFMNKGWFRKVNKNWFLFFLLNGVLTFIVIVISHWAFLNGVGRRYFVLVYISFGIVILLMGEATEKRKRRTANILLALMIFTGSISSVYQFYYPKHVPPRIKILSEFQSLGNIGLIAEYWNSYLSAAPDPVRIKATPHDKEYVRSLKLVDEVFNQPRIYIIKDMWMDSFPDTIRQFGRTLVKKGSEYYIGQCWINQYEIKNTE